jgi:hypothetical protein
MPRRPILFSATPHHDLVTAIEEARNSPLAARSLVFRNDRNSQKIADGEMPSLLEDCMRCLESSGLTVTRLLRFAPLSAS